MAPTWSCEWRSGPHGLLKLAAPLLRRREQPMFKRDLTNIKARLEGAAGHLEDRRRSTEMQTMKQATAEFLRVNASPSPGSGDRMYTAAMWVYQRLRCGTGATKYSR